MQAGWVWDGGGTFSVFTHGQSLLSVQVKGENRPWVVVVEVLGIRPDPDICLLLVCQLLLLIEKIGDWKKMEILVKNQSF